MEEDFELISKGKLKLLQEENIKLKEELAKKQNTPKATRASPDVSKKQNEALVKKIIEALHEESQKERNLILSHLDEIKDLNKTTLDNLLSKTEHLDSKLENMVETITDLISSLKDIVHQLTEFENDSIKEEIKKIQDLKLDEGLEKTNEKLKDIDLFMKNLRTLLSYVKPNDLKIDIPRNTNQKPISNQNSIPTQKLPLPDFKIEKPINQFNNQNLNPQPNKQQPQQTFKMPQAGQNLNPTPQQPNNQFQNPQQQQQQNKQPQQEQQKLNSIPKPPTDLPELPPLK